MFEIFTLGGGVYLVDLLNAVAAITGGGAFVMLAQLTGVAGLAWVLFRTAFGGSWRDNVKWILLFTAVWGAMIVPKATVRVVDRLDPALAPAVVANVPMGLALFASLTSQVGDGLTRLTEQTFALPTDLAYQRHGMIFGARLAAEATRLEVTDAVFAQNLRNYAQQCVFYALLLGHVTADELRESADLWTLVTSARTPSAGASPARMVEFATRNGAGGINRAIITCSAAATQLGAQWNAEIQRAGGVFGRRLFPDTATEVLARAELMTALPAAHDFLIGASRSAQEIMRQQMLLNAVHDAGAQWAAEAGNAAALRAYTEARAEAQTVSAYRAIGRQAETWVPLLRVVFECLYVGAFPMAALLMLTPAGAGIFRSYVTGLVWLQSWGPLYAVLHRIAMGEAAERMTAHALMPGGDIITLDTPGVYRFSFRSADGAITGRANPILVKEAPERRIYWGDTHGHSGFAEGVGTPQRFMEWAREDARLDYVTHSEHDIWMDDREWNVLNNIVQNATLDGHFVAFAGYEWTVRNLQGGHHNVLFRRPFQGPRIPAQEYGTLSRLYQGLRTHHDPRDVVVIPHAHQSGDYRHSDPELEPLVEIMSQHGNFEWFGRMYLNHGHQVGFIAASDNHLSQPGYSAPKGGSLSQRGGLGALLATERTTDALFDAMKSLDTYATTGDRIILDVSVNGTGMGQRAEFAERRVVRGRAIGTAPIDSIALVKNDREIDRREFPAESGPPRDGQYQLTFHSDSTPMHPGDNPRGWRGWRGQLEVEGGTIANAIGRDLHNANIQAVELVDATTLRFATHTRGGPSSLLLTLADVKRLGQMTLTLEQATEFGGGPPRFRTHQTTPPGTVELALRDASRGQATADIPFGEYTDRVRLRRARTEGAMDVAFEFTDEGTRHGDWYFIRVTQANDAMAWSSPIWIGGFPKR